MVQCLIVNSRQTVKGLRPQIAMDILLYMDSDPVSHIKRFALFFNVFAPSSRV